MKATSEEHRDRKLGSLWRNIGQRRAAGNEERGEMTEIEMTAGSYTRER